MSDPKFEVKPVAGGQFRFNLKAPNGEIILTSESYTTKQGCEAGISSVRQNAPFDVRYERRDAPGNYRFNLKAANGERIGHSEGYTTLASRDRGIDAVKRNAPLAVVVYLT